MKKRVGHSREENLAVLFLVLFLFIGFIFSNMDKLSLTGMQSGGDSCELTTDPYGNEYCEGYHLTKFCAWIPLDQDCKFVSQSQTCFGTHTGYCYSPQGQCTSLSHGRHGCVGV